MATTEPAESATDSADSAEAAMAATANPAEPAVVSGYATGKPSAPAAVTARLPSAAGGHPPRSLPLPPATRPDRGRLHRAGPVGSGPAD
ncbi:hypothetical protein I552_5794 [Mycobacterium xenopi 3993]|nr:hypothetical protein I552_5794 [Mycobacterium xenopi 3993]